MDLRLTSTGLMEGNHEFYRHDHSEDSYFHVYHRANSDITVE